MTESATTSRLRLHPEDLAGPILAGEARMASRRLGSYLLRAGYLAAMMIYVAGVISATLPEATLVEISRMADAGRYIIGGILGFQFIVLQLVTVVLLSGAITREIQRRTLSGLLTLPMSDARIVAGKVGAGVLQVATLLLCGLPLLALVRILGGITWSHVAAVTMVTLGQVVVAGTLAVWCSAALRNPFLAGLLAAIATLMYSLLGGWVLLLVIILVALSKAANSPGAGCLMATLLLVGVPLVAITVTMAPWSALAVIPAVLVFSSDHGAGAGSIVFALINVGLQLGAARILIGWSAASLEALRRDEPAQGVADPPTAPAPIASLPPVAAAVGPAPAQAPPPAPGGCPPTLTVADPNPLIVENPKETYLRLRSAVVWKDGRINLERAGMLDFMLCYPLLMGLVVLMATTMLAPQGFRPEHRLISLIPLLGALVLTGFSAAGSISAERQAGTWSALLGLPNSDAGLARQKVLGIFWRSRVIWAGLAVYIVLFLVSGAMELLDALSLAATAAACFLFLAGLGLLAGTLTARPPRAIIIVVLAAAAAWVGLPWLIDVLADSSYDATAFDVLSPIYLLGRIYGMPAFRPSLHGWLLGQNIAVAAEGLLMMLLAVLRFRTIP